MDHFNYRNEDLYVEDVPLAQLIEEFGTPSYVYSRAMLEERWHVFDQAFVELPHRICYAVKANSNIAILNVLARLGSGFDIVSGGELARVLAAGGDARKIIFSGIGKTAHEIHSALSAGISCFNVEVSDELARINEIAGSLNKKAPISLRINPNVDAGTHPYITTGLKDNKFGIPIQDAVAIYEYASKLEHLNIVGIAFHIGSQQLDVAPFAEALRKVAALIPQLEAKGILLKVFDVGGGMGVRYSNEIPPEPKEYAKIVAEAVAGRAMTVIAEPGRAIVANAGMLLTRVEYLKHTLHGNFAIVDAGMNDLLRPSLYQAWHDIIPIKKCADLPLREYDVVGPVCESSDCMGKKRILSLTAGDALAICSAGAYGFSMSSHYNSRPGAVEILVDKDRYFVIRERETVADLFKLENLLPE
jgi:diaminopimelate decarboxylase